MKNKNLEKAEELRIQFNAIENIIVGECKDRDILELAFQKLKIIKQEIKALKEKIESVGCGKEYHHKDDPKDNMILWRRTCGGINRTGFIGLCPNCQEALEICEEMLK